MRFRSLALAALVFASCGGNEMSPISSVAPERNANSRACLNLNTATAEELTSLPGIGEVVARRIIEYRERNGAFRRPQDIIIIDGMSEKKYRRIAYLLCV